jgi:hypothetical protein
MAQAVHCESVAVVQVMLETQWSTEAHSMQESARPGGPSCRKVPLEHWVHWESVGLVQVTAEAQDGTSVHGTQESAAPVAPSWRNKPPAHTVHCESVAFVQVTALRQESTRVQGRHSVPLEYVPGAQGAQTLSVHIGVSGWLEQSVSRSHSTMKLKATSPWPPFAEVPEPPTPTPGS